MIEFHMPSLGADMEAATLQEWLVKPGDSVKKGDIIAVVETQKGLIDIELYDVEAGRIFQLLVEAGTKVPVGMVMATIASEEELTNAPALPVSAPRIRASPLARKLAEQEKIDLAAITGSGPEGAITREDVEKALQKKAPVPAVPATDLRMAVANAMSKANREIPHYYLVARADMSKALSWLEKENQNRSLQQRLLPVVLLIKAVAKALQQVPELNAWWQDGIQVKKEIHIGFVVSVRGGGLMIPAIRDADKKNLDQIMETLSGIIPRARSFRLRSSELSDATVTITNLGGSGADAVFGIVYPPQVAIIGFGGINPEPWAENDLLGVRPVVHITLAADHRATDGQTGSRFLEFVKSFLQKPEQL